MFGQTRYGYTYNVVSNMGTWPAVMHLLWRAATEAYRGAMYDLMVMSPTTSTRGDRFAQVSAPDCTLDEKFRKPDLEQQCILSLSHGACKNNSIVYHLIKNCGVFTPR